jgi:hypothetical protein
VAFPAVKERVGWAEAIERAFAQEADVVPPGWQTLNEVAAEMGQNKYHVCKVLNRMIALGKAETKKFRTWIRDTKDPRGRRSGYLRMNRHYRLISPATRASSRRSGG